MVFLLNEVIWKNYLRGEAIAELKTAEEWVQKDMPERFPA